MLRYDRQIEPGLVALYDIRPGNGAGLFLQPRARTGRMLWESDRDEQLSLNSHADGSKCSRIPREM